MDDEIMPVVETVAPPAVIGVDSIFLRGVYSPAGRSVVTTLGHMTQYNPTLRLMTARRLRRELMGTYSKERPWRVMLWVLAFVALEVGLATITLNEGVLIEVKINVLVNLVGALLLVVILYCALQVVSVLRWCLFWIACGSIATLILTPQHKLSILKNLTAQGLASIIFGFTGLACVLNILLWVHYNKVSNAISSAPHSMRTPRVFPSCSTWRSYSSATVGYDRCTQNRVLWSELRCALDIVRPQVYPKAVEASFLCLADLKWYFNVRAIRERPGFFSYRIPLPFPLWLPCWGRRQTFGYFGEVDKCGRPHGLGTWHDDARHGECLQGVWEHGKPIGPFRASEYHSDYRFANVRLGFAQNR